LLVIRENGRGEMAKRVATTTREAVGYIARAVEAHLVAVAPVLVVSLVLVMVVS